MGASTHADIPQQGYRYTSHTGQGKRSPAPKSNLQIRGLLENPVSCIGIGGSTEAPSSRSSTMILGDCKTHIIQSPLFGAHFPAGCWTEKPDRICSRLERYFFSWLSLNRSPRSVANFKAANVSVRSSNWWAAFSAANSFAHQRRRSLG